MDDVVVPCTHMARQCFRNRVHTLRLELCFARLALYMSGSPMWEVTGSTSRSTASASTASSSAMIMMIISTMARSDQSQAGTCSAASTSAAVACRLAGSGSRHRSNTSRVEGDSCGTARSRCALMAGGCLSG